MLVLNRKPGQGFTIGDNIRVVFLSYNRSEARIGIEAPDDVRILREELTDYTKQSGEHHGK